MIKFVYYQKYIKVQIDDEDVKLPNTLIQVEDASNEGVMKTCQSWLDALGLTDREYQILIRVHQEEGYQIDSFSFCLF